MTPYDYLIKQIDRSDGLSHGWTAANASGPTSPKNVDRLN
jgi:hypothetical protein